MDAGVGGPVVLLGLSVLIGLINGFFGFANQATLYLEAPAGTVSPTPASTTWPGWSARSASARCC
jgi:hypothetical protein